MDTGILKCYSSYVDNSVLYLSCWIRSRPAHDVVSSYKQRYCNVRTFYRGWNNVKRHCICTYIGKDGSSDLLIMIHKCWLYNCYIDDTSCYWNNCILFNKPQCIISITLAARNTSLSIVPFLFAIFINR